MLFPVYEDAGLSRPVSQPTLVEGVTYHLDLRTFTPEARLALIEAARLIPFAAFNPLNSVCSFRIDGYVGKLRLGDEDYEVRSAKLALFGDGTAQFAAMLARIDEIMCGLKFRYSSPTRRTAVLDPMGPPPTDLERLDAFRQAIEGNSGQRGIFDLVAEIIRMPHAAMSRLRLERSLEAARYVDIPRLAQTLGRRCLQSAGAVRDSRMVFKAADGARLLPVAVPSRQIYLNSDTLENRFVKHFLGEIEGVCLRVLAAQPTDALILADAKETLAGVRRFSRDPFFVPVGRLHSVPAHSPVLNGDDRYFGLYEAYLRSRSGVLDPLETARRQLRSSPLKDIATLYELWCFAELANAFLDKARDIVVVASKLSGLAYGTTWSDGEFTVAYNPTFRGRAISYSLTLRPDIVVRRGLKAWAFDAKYRANRLPQAEQSDDAAAETKASDIHKMHTYIDAIAEVQTAVVVYPGTEADWFPRSGAATDRRAAALHLGGVGGIPLLPLGANAELNSIAVELRRP